MVGLGRYLLAAAIESTLARRMSRGAGPLDAIVQSAQRVETSMVQEVARWATPPNALLVFGSFARRSGGSESDVDILLARPARVEQDSSPWRDQRRQLAQLVETLTGMRCRSWISASPSSEKRSEGVNRWLLRFALTAAN